MCIYFNKSHLLCPSSRRHTKKRSVRAFSVSQDRRAILVFPLKMKWGGKSCPAAFPPAIRVIVSLVPDLRPFLYIYIKL